MIGGPSSNIPESQMIPIPSSSKGKVKATSSSNLSNGAHGSLSPAKKYRDSQFAPGRLVKPKSSTKTFKSKKPTPGTVIVKDFSLEKPPAASTSSSSAGSETHQDNGSAQNSEETLLRVSNISWQISSCAFDIVGCFSVKPTPNYGCVSTQW